MKKLIEVAFHKASRQPGLEDFDFTKSALGNNFPYVTKKPLMSDPKNNLPIKPDESDWEVFSDALHKTFNFKSIEHMLYFIEELVKQSNTIQHHPEIKIVDKTVDIMLTTHELGEVSDLDLRLSKFCDEIFEDIYYIEEFE